MLRCYYMEIIYQRTTKGELNFSLACDEDEKNSFCEEATVVTTKSL